MKLDWRQAAAAFQSRSPRERLLIMLVGLALILGAGWLLWIESAILQRNRLMLRIEEHSVEHVALQARLEALRTGPMNPDVARQAQIAVLQTQLDGINAEFAGFERTLVAPREMGQLVKGLLAQHGGLELLAWRSLPVSSLRELLAAQQAGAGTADAATPGPAARPGAANSAAAASSAGAASAGDSWLYVHGIEISVSGNYVDMQAWLEQIERLPRHFYWGALNIEGKAWPASVMTVTLYTVSLERTWWSL